VCEGKDGHLGPSKHFARSHLAPGRGRTVGNAHENPTRRWIGVESFPKAWGARQRVRMQVEAPTPQERAWGASERGGMKSSARITAWRKKAKATSARAISGESVRPLKLKKMARAAPAGRGGCGEKGGRGGRGRGAHGKSITATIPRNTTEVGACKELEGHIFTIGSGNKGKDGDMLRTSIEKMATYIGTKFGDDAAQEWISGKRIVLPEPAYSQAIRDRHEA
jgi:hypothetical protein